MQKRSVNFFSSNIVMRGIKLKEVLEVYVHLTEMNLVGYVSHGHRSRNLYLNIMLFTYLGTHRERGLRCKWSLSRNFKLRSRFTNKQSDARYTTKTVKHGKRNITVSKEFDEILIGVKNKFLWDSFLTTK
ncbi:uncharacterized protein LOC119650740 [Hermetia illucens]|uniref:uncharacterized protein LOC119650740 n=1 Tax=Hermetia illucens TaxID=343691 RepID=UPI0018CC0993|nr:uncharacterized protein LOC119650740 [Hermetia illucens]